MAKNDVQKAPQFGEPGWEKWNSDQSKFYCEGPSMTEQSHKDSCDINFLMSRYEKAGILPRGKDGQPFFGDFTGISDFQSAQNAIILAEESFMQLPAKVRSRFDNDPGKLLQFLEDTNNKSEAISLGLIDPPASAVDPAPSPVVPPVP